MLLRNGWACTGVLGHFRLDHIRGLRSIMFSYTLTSIDGFSDSVLWVVVVIEGKGGLRGSKI